MKPTTGVLTLQWDKLSKVSLRTHTVEQIQELILQAKNLAVEFGINLTLPIELTGDPRLYLTHANVKHADEVIGPSGKTILSRYE